MRVLKHTIKKIVPDNRFTGLGSTLAALLRSLDSRLLKYEDNNTLIAATILDPRYKNSLFKNSEEESKSNLQNVQQFLVNTVKARQVDVTTHEENISSSTCSDIDPEVESLGLATTAEADAECQRQSMRILDFDSCLDELLTSEPEESNVEQEDKGKKRMQRQNSSLSRLTEKMSNELQKYCAQPLESRNSDPLQWWRDNRVLYPELAPLAGKMLCSPPSSIESERLFSIGGNVYTPHRNRLTPETGEKLMLLNYNLRIFNFEY